MSPQHGSDDRRGPSLNRRTLFAGASTVGALAAVATVLPKQAPEAVEAVQAPKPERGGGYHLSEHVKHYYKTTQI
jgi:hypothetical protein